MEMKNSNAKHSACDLDFYDGQTIKRQKAIYFFTAEESINSLSQCETFNALNRLLFSAAILPKPTLGQEKNRKMG